MKNQKLSNELYESYCKGEIKFKELINILKTNRFLLEKLFKENGFLHRQEVLKQTTKHDFFDKIDSEIKAYLLGFYFADGCITNNNYLSISLTENDKEIVELFQKEIGPYYKITHTKPNKNKKTGFISKPMCSININSKQIFDKLTEYGIGVKKTQNSNFNFDIIPKELMSHFIRGYFDGDGVVCETRGFRKIKNKEYPYTNYNWSIISSKKENIIPIQEFLYEQYNIKSNIINDKRGNFLIEINKKKDFFKIREILYENAHFFLKRKKEKFFNIEYNKKEIIKMKGDKIIKVFDSLTEASKDENITPQGIANRIKKKMEINGFTWIMVCNGIEEVS